MTSDFLAAGGDGALVHLKLPPGAIQLTDVIIRDAIAELLRKQRGQIDPAKFAAKRLDYEGERPVTCGGANRPGPKQAGGGQASPDKDTP